MVRVVLQLASRILTVWLPLRTRAIALNTSGFTVTLNATKSPHDRQSRFKF